MVPTLGLYQRGLLMFLMDGAIPFLCCGDYQRHFVALSLAVGPCLNMPCTVAR
jgi:hypothetical protein